MGPKIGDYCRGVRSATGITEQGVLVDLHGGSLATLNCQTGVYECRTETVEVVDDDEIPPWEIEFVRRLRRAITQ